MLKAGFAPAFGFIIMNNRLNAIVSQINNGIGVADIGTDHAYIPVYLAKNGYSGTIIASDINEGPLNMAKRTAAEAGVEEKIVFYLSDGLDCCPPEKIDTIVIAGMGGDLICDILDRAEWCMSSQYKLILQPMTKGEVLRYWLINNEFEIISEVLAEDGGTIYQIMSVRYGVNARLSDAELFTGEYGLIKEQLLSLKLIDKYIARFESALDGLHHSHKENSSREKIYEDILQRIEEMK